MFYIVSLNFIKLVTFYLEATSKYRVFLPLWKVALDLNDCYFTTYRSHGNKDGWQKRCATGCRTPHMSKVRLNYPVNTEANIHIIGCKFTMYLQHISFRKSWVVGLSDRPIARRIIKWTQTLFDIQFTEASVWGHGKALFRILWRDFLREFDIGIKEIWKLQRWGETLIEWSPEVSTGTKSPQDWRLIHLPLC